MAPYEALYGHKCHTLLCWTKLGERRVLGPELVSKTEDKVRLIRDRLKADSDRQKSYTDLKMRDIEYSVGDFVFLKYRSDPSHVVSVEEIKIKPDLTFEEDPIQILDHDVKVLRRKSIPLVKLLWQNHGAEEATYGSEDSMRQQYPYLF
ncbi:uncharacterized protein LOC128035457 [Gossypium raimondii]|uniref:uncharacterized protein LOC128035457 n=1 Tax=Gossypium raimondii TaxID=29730 RepID=UPI00227AC1D4|nr:uncharacterized protein LOC128035457 [Gossypium raimondii]